MTSAVQPVWWLAPRPAPLSPWKYSWNSRLSRQAGSSAKRSLTAEDRAPPGLVGEPDAHEAVGEVAGHLADGVARGRSRSGTRG